MLFSFSFVSALPSWNSSDDFKMNNNTTNNYNQKRVLQYSSLIAMIFKIIFSISFACLVIFQNDFSMNNYINYKESQGNLLFNSMIITLGIFLIFTLYNGIVNHTHLLYTSIKSDTQKGLNCLIWLIVLTSPWFLSLLLLSSGKVFLNLLNW